MSAGKKLTNGFSIFLIVYSALLICCIVFGLTWVWGLLVDYESGLAEVNADKVVSEFYIENIADTLRESGASAGEFENLDMLCSAYESRLQDKEIVYKRNSGVYTAASPVYYVIADDVPFAEFSLVQTGVNGHGFPVWEQGEITFLENFIETESVTIRVPSGAEVRINGIVADPDQYITEKEAVSLAENIGEYVDDIPGYDIYTIDGLTKTPEITVEADNLSGPVISGNEYVYDYAEDETLIAENEELIKRIGTNYGGYIINRVSFGTLAADLTGNAQSYMSDIPAIWAYLYGETYTYDFTDWNITNVKKYSEDCFSCSLEFVLNVHYRVTNEISYDTKLDCMFIRKDGRWYLADFTIG